MNMYITNVNLKKQLSDFASILSNREHIKKNMYHEQYEHSTIIT